MFNARENYADHVKSYQDQREVARGLMQIVNPLYAPKYICRHHNAAGAEDDQSCEQRDYHSATRRVVAKVARRSQTERIREIAEDHSRAIHEVAEARV